MQTYYVVQTYSVNTKRKLEADEPRLVQSEAQARRMVERFSKTKFGVVAFSRTGDPQTDDWDDVKILCSYGDFPQEDIEAIRSSV